MNYKPNCKCTVHWTMKMKLWQNTPIKIIRLFGYQKAVIFFFYQFFSGENIILLVTQNHFYIKKKVRFLIYLLFLDEYLALFNFSIETYHDQKIFLNWIQKTAKYLEKLWNLKIFLSLINCLVIRIIKIFTQEKTLTTLFCEIRILIARSKKKLN